MQSKPFDAADSVGQPVARRFATELSVITRLALPVALSEGGVVLLGLVEFAILGRRSTTVLAGAAVGRTLSLLALAPVIGIAAAVEPLSAQAVGAGDAVSSYRTLQASLRVGVATAAVCALLAVLSTYLLTACGVEPQVAAPARAFLIGQSPGLVLTATYLAGKAYLQTHNRTSPAFVAVICANILNVFVCSLLVGGDEQLVELGMPPIGLPPLGALGAGLASSIASVVLSGFVLVAVRRVRPRALAADVRMPTALLIRIGSSIGVQALAELGAISATGVFASRFGAVPVSAHQIALGLISVAYMGNVGLGIATSVRVGQAVGAGAAVRPAGLAGLAVGVACTTALSACLVIFSGDITRLFSPDPAVIALGARLLVLAAVVQLFQGAQAVLAGALRGMADAWYPLLANVVAHWFIGVPLGLTLAYWQHYGPVGLWWGLFTGNLLVALLLGKRFISMSSRTIRRVVD